MTTEEQQRRPPEWAMRMRYHLKAEAEAREGQGAALGVRCPKWIDLGQRCTADAEPEHEHRHDPAELPTNLPSDDEGRQRHWELAQRRVDIGRELMAELFRYRSTRTRVAARAALRAAIDLIEMSPLKPGRGQFLEGHWVGVTEAAMRVISAVESEMYDPRSHPERYEGRS